MKLWLKIYLFSLLLLIFTFNIAGVVLIENIYKDMALREVDRCIGEENLVCLQLEINSMTDSKDVNKYSNINTSISTLMQEYNNSIVDESGNHGYIEMYDSNNEILYKDINFPVSDDLKELDNLSYGTNNYVLRKIDTKNYIYVTRLVNVFNTDIKVHYAKDVSNIYKERTREYALFIRLSIIISAFFAVFMFFISRLIAKPIKTLINSTEKISRGDYSERVKISSNDEFKSLSDHFNKMAQTVEDKVNELEKSNIEKEAFINNFTHELKTPLTSIIGYANIIRTSKYNEELFFESADYIYKQGKRLEAMAFKMMDLIYARTQNIELKNQDVMPIIYEVQKSMKPKLEGENIELLVEGCECRLNMDKDLINMAICNLVENAIKASKDNSKIILKVSVIRDETFICVKDFGMGIPKEHLDKIWQPFYVVDKARSRKNNGAGIGMAICKRIAEVHNAHMKINSKVGVGTEVTIIFRNEELRANN